jgi:succinate dehydrogenase/fumarate reductase flavoprotein subunit
MAEALWSGGAVHGDIALAEAIGSAEAFYHLVSIGVPFPMNGSGGFVGYKTDHDPRKRGTSIGPYTSKVMVERLLAEVRSGASRSWRVLHAVALVAEPPRTAPADK